MFEILINKLKSKKIKNVVISSSLINSNLKLQLDQEGFIIESFLDSRSAGYAATGICAELRNPVVLITENDNDSRNCYSALTEAYYKKFPIIFISIVNGYTLDYVNELRDTTISTSFIDASNPFNPVVIDMCLEKSMPVHIVVNNIIKNVHKIDDISEHILPINQDDVYIYMSNSFTATSCRNIRQNIAGGCDGVVSNVLGASLSGVYRKYIGISTDIELLHDLNTLGNRFMNDAVSFFIYAKDKQEIIENYGRDLGFSIYIGRENIDKLVDNKKSMVFIDRSNYGD